MKTEQILVQPPKDEPLTVPSGTPSKPAMTINPVLAVVLVVLFLVAVVAVPLALDYHGRNVPLAQGNAAPTTVKKPSMQEGLKEALSYLKTEVDEIAWIHFHENEAAIGWSTLPADWDTVIHFAALEGNKAIGFGVRIFSFNANTTPKPAPGTTMTDVLNSTPTYYGVCAFRHGVLESCTARQCKK